MGVFVFGTQESWENAVCDDPEDQLVVSIGSEGWSSSQVAWQKVERSNRCVRLSNSNLQNAL